MAKTSLITSVRRWKPDPDDPRGDDKLALLEFLLEYGRGQSNSIPLRRVVAEAPFENTYTRESLQQALIVPLRSEGKVFIGTGSRGVFLIDEPEDADATISFYTTRIRSELRHIRNLKNLARRSRLFSGYKSAKSAAGKSAIIYFDESGTPSMRDTATSPFFIVCAVHVESSRELALLTRRFDWIRDLLGKPPDFEFKSTALSRKKYERVLKELEPSEFSWACVCFVKSRLKGMGFADPSTFFRYAYQFLVGDLLSISWNADLYFDQYSGKDSTFAREFKKYVRDQNAGLPPDRLKDIEMLESHREPLIQLADLLAGVVKNREKGSYDLQHLVDDKAVAIRVWPPEEE